MFIEKGYQAFRNLGVKVLEFSVSVLAWIRHRHLMLDVWPSYLSF